MKNLLLTLSILFAAYTASMAQCYAGWLGWSNANYTATFVDSSGTDPNATTYVWDFGDGNTSSQQNPTHQYASGGWHLVCFSVATTINGVPCQHQHCDSLYVGQMPSTCAAGFTYTNTPNGNHILLFNNTSQSSGGSASYVWDFGDGLSSSQASPTHTYDTSGTYTVCLTVNVGNNGSIVCTDQYCSTVTVNVPATCSALFGYQTSGLNAYLTGPSGYGQSWDFGDGTTTGAHNPAHTFANGGTYNVCLTVLDSATQCTDTYCTDITVTGSNTTTCDASFNAYPSAVSNYQFFFDSGNPNGPIYSSHSWDFGDGTIDSNSTPTHVYQQAGNYLVCHTVTSRSGNGTLLCTDTHCDTLVVQTPQSCYASFTANYTNNTYTSFQFTNYSTGNGNLTYFWDFGDSATTSTLANPTHTYSQSGTYSVCLTISDASGGAVNCTDTYCLTINAGSNNVFTLQGLVYSDSSTGVWSEAEVFLIRYDSVGQTLTAIDTAQTNGGWYSFPNVAAGNYLIKAAILPNYPGYNDYLPTYYQNELFWYDAATITVPNPASNGYYHIVMIQGNNPGGPGFVGGNVNQGANKQASGDPIEGVQVMLLNMDDSPVQYTYSDANGSFEFENVAYGTYKVYSEVIGKPTYPAIVTLSAEKESVTDVQVVIEEEGVYNAITEVEVTYLDGTNFFPNPVSATGNLVFNAKENGTVQVQIINMLGQTVSEQSMDVAPGNQHLTVDMGKHQAGLYMLTISFNNHVAAHLRFIRE